MRVVIAEDSLLLREGLTRLLEDDDIDVVAANGDAESFLRSIETHEPELAVVDVRMPPTFTDEGLRAAILVRDRWPHIALLILSQYVEERHATDLLTNRADATGGFGYLLKDRVGDLAQFHDTIRRVANGDTVLDPEVVAQLLTRRRNELDTLTNREHQVLALMAQGRTNTAIAAELVVGTGAIEKHINNIFNKLGLEPANNDHRRVLAVLTYLQR